VAAAPTVTVLGGGYTHPSDIKALGMLGVGRARVQKLARDDVGRVDLAAMEAKLRDLDGGPAIVIGSAGEVNAGDFDPLNEMADLAERYDAWFHVDGAFGLFAGLSSRSKHLVEGVERADSVIADGHKWLNVPYENGFAFVHDQALLPAVFGGAGAAYLPDVDEPQPNWGYRGPEMSRRARSFPVWATLRAYGREGHRAIVEHDLDLAQHLTRVVDQAPELERLADVPLNVVCFRYRPAGSKDGPELDALNRRIGEAAITDGRVFFGSTVYGGRVAFRPAIVNWRAREQDVELVAEVVLELGARFTA
jgi:glutamate/tyrosine decarboxylase-like PLP-dependent enzyme